MAIVYRVEDLDGNGPYQQRWKWADAGIEKPAFLRDVSDSNKYNPDPHPAPYEDGIENVDFEDVFGFRTLTMLGAWMLREKADDAHRLDQMGFQVGVYECLHEDVREGSRQCVFRKKRAAKVRSMTLHDVLELLPIPNELPG
ncbi:hypothetical protein SEA_VITAS_46 [Microbacterium phage Vitas]|uniref:Uncharacterized protein n=1 Tax=Microbacterium phage Vitas TaxID=2603259 RepID=A0A5B8WHJ9_9CAUD|nr:hypothetical protein SEA_VITAS_46 [Microbacterium phage Vitas]